jgi:hypothetical protein
MVSDLAKGVNLSQEQGTDPGYTEADFAVMTIGGIDGKDGGPRVKTRRGLMRNRGLLNDVWYVNIYCAMFLVLYRDLPKYIHDENEVAREIIKWRLNIGK